MCALRGCTPYSVADAILVGITNLYSGGERSASAAALPVPMRRRLHAMLGNGVLEYPLPPLESSRVVESQCEPLSMFTPIRKSLMPVSLDAGRIVGLHKVNGLESLR